MKGRGIAARYTIAGREVWLDFGAPIVDNHQSWFENGLSGAGGIVRCGCCSSTVPEYRFRWNAPRWIDSDRLALRGAVRLDLPHALFDVTETGVLPAVMHAVKDAQERIRGSVLDEASLHFNSQQGLEACQKD